jgi:hypothetical protein
MQNVSLLTTVLYLSFFSLIKAQSADTIVVELAPSSKMILTVGDTSDLGQLKKYDYDAMFKDILSKLDSKDTVDTPEAIEPSVKSPEEPIAPPEPISPPEEHDNKAYSSRTNRTHRPYQSFNFDFGINNFLEDGKFPDDHNAQYTVRPWGSWNVGVNSVLHMDICTRFFVELGFGVSWYNFKFEDAATTIVKGEDGLSFGHDQRDLTFQVSKLSATYLNASFIPMFAAGKYHHHSRWGNQNHDSFRIGVGPYAGYRLESHTKQGYTLDGEKKADKQRDNFYLNNFRYGVRMQMGLQSMDFFAAYDLNELFVAGKGPKLNAFTLGVVF